MPVPVNRAKIQLARGDLSNIISNPGAFEEGELAYAIDENLLYIKEGGSMIRLEYVTTADLIQVVANAISLSVTGQDGVTSTNTGTNTVVSLDEAFLREKVGITDGKMPSGFIDKNTTVIAHRPVEQKIWFYPVGAEASVWCQGIKHTFTSYKEVAEPSATGLYYIYLDSAFNLQIKSTEFDYQNDTPVCQFYWNQTSSTPVIVSDHRHGIAMDWSTLNFLKNSSDPEVYSGFEVSGVTSNPDGSSDGHAKFQLSDGVAGFHDIEISVDHNATPASNVASNLFQQILQPSAQIPVFYQTSTVGNSEWTYDTATEYAYLENSGVPAYNGAGTNWVKTNVNSGAYFISFICVTQNTEYPVIAISGQGSYSTPSDAKAVTLKDLVLEDFDNVPLLATHKIIFKYDSAYTSTKKVVIEEVQNIKGQSSTNAVTDHGRLTGLTDDDHPQYVHLDVARTITANHQYAGRLNVTNVTAATNSSTGAMTVAGGLGVAGNLHLDGDLSTTIDGGNF